MIFTVICICKIVKAVLFNIVKYIYTYIEDLTRVVISYEIY